MSVHKPTILMINMASGFGGGEVQTEELMLNLTNYNLCFFGKSSGKFIARLKEKAPHIQIVNMWQMLRLVFRCPNLIVHAQDGRGAHIAGFLKKISGKPVVITRHVSFPFKRKSSLSSYQNANMLVGVSQQVTDNLKPLNTNYRTIYGCIKPLLEDAELEQKYFAQKNGLSIAHVGNLQPVKNFQLTLSLAEKFSQIQFFIVGSGELEQELKQQAANLSNVTFIPFTPYIGSIFKQVDLQLVPSHSEGLGAVILEGYQYQVPVIAHQTGGVPEIVQNQRTGFLVENNDPIVYQQILTALLDSPQKLAELKQHVAQYIHEHDFSAQRMAREYEQVYSAVLGKRA